MAKNNVKIELFVTGNYDVDDDFGVDQATNVNFHKLEVDAKDEEYEKEIKILATAIVCEQIVAKLASMVADTDKDVFKQKLHIMKHINDLQMPEILKNMLSGDEEDD